MTVLLDENLSPRLALDLADLFETITHTRDLGLRGASDLQIWSASSAFDLLVTTDRDFLAIVAQLGPPPKVVRIGRADVPTKQISALLRRHAIQLRALIDSERAALVLQAR